MLISNISDIIERVKNPTTRVPFRPHIPTQSCDSRKAKLMSDCWAENPSERPDFSAIQRELKILNGGK